MSGRCRRNPDGFCRLKLSHEDRDAVRLILLAKTYSLEAQAASSQLGREVGIGVYLEKIDL